MLQGWAQRRKRSEGLVAKSCDAGAALPCVLRIVGAEFLRTLCKLEFDPIPKLPTSRGMTQGQGHTSRQSIYQGLPLGEDLGFSRWLDTVFMLWSSGSLIQS